MAECVSIIGCVLAVLYVTWMIRIIVDEQEGRG